VGDAIRADGAVRGQLDRGVLRAGEEWGAAAQHDRHHVQPQLVDEAPVEAFPDDRRATFDADVTIQGDRAGHGHGSHEAIGHEGVGGATFLVDRRGRAMGHDEYRTVEDRVVAPRLDSDVERGHAHHDDADARELAREVRLDVLAGLAEEHPVVEPVAIVAHAVADPHVRSGDVAVEGHGQVRVGGSHPGIVR
jgi:hypothetical protein